MGPGTVLAYFVEFGYLGLQVEIGGRVAMLFGAELES